MNQFREKNVTENLFSGIPFEERCQMAINYLRSNMEEYKSTDAGLSPALQELLEPKSDEPEVVAELKREMLQDATASQVAFVEKITDIAWKSCVSMSTILYGEDATEFAIEAMKRERDKSVS